MFLQFKAGYNDYCIEVEESRVGEVSAALLTLRALTDNFDGSTPVAGESVNPRIQILKEVAESEVSVEQ